MDRKLLLVLCVGLLIRVAVGAVLPITDPTEGRYALIAHEMAASGDWVTPRLWLDGEPTPYLGKPPLFFWATALSIRLLGPTEFAVRLPAAIAATALLILLFLVLKQMHGNSVAATGVAITATTGLVFFLFSAVIVDLQLMLFSVGAVLAHLSFVRAQDDRSKRWWSLLVFALLAGGLMTKGPVAIVLFALPVGIWTAMHKKWAELRAHHWRAGLLVFLAIAAPWFVLAEVRNPGFLRYFLINENLLRFLSTGYGDRYGTGHPLPRGSAAVLFFIGTLPWAPFAIWLVVKRRWEIVRSTLHDEASSLFFVGFLSIVAFWSLARQVLPTYVLPAIPLFGAWLACELRLSSFAARKFRTAITLTLAAWCLLLFALIPAFGSRSSRAILAETTRVLAGRDGSTEVVFAGRAPHSAFYYAPGLITPHSPETLQASIRRVLQAGGRGLLVIRTTDWEGLPEDSLPRARILSEVPGWKLVEPTVANRTTSRGGLAGAEPADRRDGASRVDPEVDVAQDLAIGARIMFGSGDWGRRSTE